MIKKILVTGSSGTIGTRLCEKLLEKDYEVVGVDRRPNEWSDRINSLTIRGDLRNKEVLGGLPKDFDLVVHLAANARVYNLVVKPNLARDNFETTFNTLEFCRQNNIKRFIFASSRETYGNSEKTTHSEKDVQIEMCESPYAASKMAGEVLIRSYQQCYGVDFIIVRFSNVYGMYDSSDRVVPLFIKLTKENKDLTVFGKEKLLDFTYIEDAILGVIKSISSFEEARNDVYNLAFGEGTSIVEVAELIKKHMGGKNNVRIEENRTGEVVKFIADISKAKEKLNYQPEIDIENGIKKSIEWYEKNET